MSPELPFLDLGLEATGMASEIRAAAGRVLESGRYVLGAEVEGFEEDFARALGLGSAVGVGNGTDAIALALLAVGVRAGDEVVTAPLTAAFTALAVSRIGAKPVFADVEPETLMLSVESAASRVGPRTRALLPVHLFGNACDIDGFVRLARERELALVEDACQAHGGRYAGKSLGSFGRAGTFSFYPTKNLGALGDGGMVVTSEPELAAKLRRLRNGGQSSRYRHVELGFNSRLDEIQAAILRVKLTRLEAWNERRRELSRLYEEALSSSPARPVPVRAGCTSARHLFVVRAKDRERLTEHLKERGIGTLVHYPIPTHLQEAYRDLGQLRGSCPHAEKACDEILSLPLHPALRTADVERVTEAIRGFYGS